MMQQFFLARNYIYPNFLKKQKKIPHIEIKGFSTTGEKIFYLSNTSKNINLKEVRINWSRYGGIKSVEFETLGLLKIQNNIDNENLYQIMDYLQNCIVYVNGVAVFSGELRILPDESNINSRQKYIVKGYYDYLDKITFTDTYNTTLKNILVNILTDYIEPNTPIILDSSKIIDITPLVSFEIEIQDKTLIDIMDWIVNIANGSLEVERVYWYINIDGKFVFDKYSKSEVVNNFFENYNFFGGEIELNSNDIINRVMIYCTNNDGTTSYLATENNSDSQDIYGIKVEKFVYNAKVSALASTLIGRGIMKYTAFPIQKINVKKLIVSDLLTEGFYNISFAKKECKKIVNECSDVDQWDDQISSLTPVELVTTPVASGRYSIYRYWSPSDVNWLYVDLDEIVYSPVSLNFMVYLKKLNISQYSPTQYIIIRLYQDDLATYQEFYFYMTSQVNTFRKFIMDGIVLKNIKRVWFKPYTNPNGINIYFDRFEAVFNSVKTFNDELNEAEYILTKNNFYANVNFGQKPVDAKEILNSISYNQRKQLHIITSVT